MTTLAALILAVLWWRILRRPTGALPPFVTRRWQDTLPVEERNAAYLRAWEDRHHAAGQRRDPLAVRSLRNAGEAQLKRWLDHHQARARWARVPPTAWPRIAAGMAEAVERAQPLLERRVVPIRRRSLGGES